MKKLGHFMNFAWSLPILGPDVGTVSDVLILILGP